MLGNDDSLSAHRAPSKPGSVRQLARYYFTGVLSHISPTCAYSFIRPDPWTWLPVLANPGGPNFGVFLKANRSEMYDDNSQQSGSGSSSAVDRSTAHSRVKATRLNLVYQWSIHLARALEFINSYTFQSPAPVTSIVFGDLRLDSCWLPSSGRSLSVLGFQHAGFRTRSGPLHAGDIGLSRRGFQPQGRDPTLQTDLFLWGCVVYELMTGYWPGEGQGLGLEDQDFLVSRQEWPRLEAVYLGDVVRKCWTGEVTSAAELFGLVREAIAGLGVLVGDDDEIVDLSLEGLTV